MSGLPFGLQVGRQLGPRLMLSAAGAYTPVQNIRATQATAGARWYFRDDALAFYFATELGIMKLEVDDSGGQANIHVFFLAGPGIELSLHNGFSIMTDLQLGPENSGTVSSDHRGWHFSAWYRLGIGYRI